MRLDIHTKNWLSLCCSLWFVCLLALGLGFIKQKKISSIVWESQDLKNMQCFLRREKINLFQATVAELALIDGISLKISRKIKKFIAQNKLTSLDSLKKIRGIGPKKIIMLRQHVYINPK